MSRTILPLAKKDGLKVQTVDQDTLVYDSTTDKAYVLNPSAAAVWKACNGQRTVPELAQLLNRETPTDEQVVWYALGQLNELLQEPVPVPQELARISRRKFLKRAGLVAAAVAIPVVVSIVAPSPAAAQSATTICCTCNDFYKTFQADCNACTSYCVSRGGVYACDVQPCDI